MAKRNASKFVAWSGFGVGTGVSVTLNLLHTAMLNDSTIALVISAVWPVTAVIAVEVMIRVLWPKGLAWQLARYGGVGIVAAVSALISYSHGFHVLLAWGETYLTAAVGPLAIDGLMILTGAALLALHTRKVPTRRRRTTTRKPPARRPRAVKAA